MLQSPSSPRRKIWISALAVLAALSPLSRGQNFTTMVADPDPLGLGAFVSDGGLRGMDLGLEGAIKGDLIYGIGLRSEYNTNFFETENDEESELATFISPWISYTSDPEGGATFSLIANYQPSFNFYLENSELNGNDQSGDLTFRFRGGRTSLDVFGRYTQSSGTDILTGEFVEGTVASAGFLASRQIAPRTSMKAAWTYSESDFGSSDNEGATVQTASLGALWQSTERLSFGPSLRYTMNESDTIGRRHAWALLLSARYKAGERISLSAALGPEYSTASGQEDGEDEEDQLGVAASLVANYRINERLSWRTSINTAAVPAPDQANFVIDNVEFRTSLQREFLRGSLSLGLSHLFSDYQRVGETLDSRDAGKYTSIFVGYGRNVFSERIGFNSELRYSFNRGETDWEQVLVSVGLSVEF